MTDNTRYINTVTENNTRFKDPGDGYNYYNTVYQELVTKYGSIANAPDHEVNILSDNILDFFEKIEHPVLEYFKAKDDKRERLGVMYNGTGPDNTGGINQGPILNYFGGMSYTKRKSKRHRKSKRRNY